MKRLLSLLLAVCMCLSVSAILTACDHEHTYQTEWSKDATNHWHACEEEDCADVADKTQHTWNEGEITTPATEEADGVKTFTCTVCAQTKTETVTFAANAPAQTEWAQAFSATINATNLTYSHEQFVNGKSDGALTLYLDNTKYMIDGYHGKLSPKCFFFVDSDGKTYHYTSTTGETWTRENVNGIIHMPSLADILTPFESLFSSFVFDEETQTFVIDSAVVMGFNMSNVKVKIENGYVTYFTYTLTKDESNDIGANYTQVIIFKNYATTEVTLPIVSE